MNRQPLLAVSMGDPCGIGPEIVARACSANPPAPCVVVGDLAVMRRAIAQCGLEAPLALLDAPDEAPDVPAGTLALWQPPGLPARLAALPIGSVQSDAGRAALRCIEAATELVLTGRAAAIVTAPVHKQALAAAGSPYPGHTEMLQALAARGGALPEVRMMLANDELRVVLVTIHVALRRAIELLDVERIVTTIRLTHEAGRRLGLAAPRIAVAGLNPHAGEGGLFGDEEQRLIAPAIAAACAAGWPASGPFAPDTVFMRARHAKGHAGEFDFVVAMTHDHGLIPVKYLGVERGVNVTLGLPFVRTSPDHGTAFDIAGRGVADATSLRAALSVAHELCRCAARG
ncbi:MAG: 4-hydroxythreonine-4-phosphate dehydrogenase PdxA [Ideonella sp.]|nr:4-hydroxythreonine-4-phosphate dehydrogenase PdxA [Ideonella sp.]MCC7459334.1 4-hydroxythreonine-4-phosphate dehydrogenase PdxA [Nitrospira sp.]